MTIREGLSTVIQNGTIYHQLLNNKVKLLPKDWIRIYTEKNGFIKPLFSYNYKDINDIPDNVLDMRYDKQVNWLMDGGYVSIDFIIYNK